MLHVHMATWPDCQGATGLVCPPTNLSAVYVLHLLALHSQYYEEIHTPGRDFPFKVRGGSYLTDGVKVQAGQPMFELLGMELVDTGGPKTCPHISRFLPSVRWGVVLCARYRCFCQCNTAIGPRTSCVKISVP